MLIPHKRSFRPICVVILQHFAMIWRAPRPPFGAPFAGVLTTRSATAGGAGLSISCKMEQGTVLAEDDRAPVARGA
jgi:hypothetical protein